MSDTNKTRISKYLKRTRPETFTAGDIAKALNFSTCQVGGYLKDIPGVSIKSHRKLARVESGNQYTYHDPECAA